MNGLILGDPFAALNPVGDTSLMIAAEALARGHPMFYGEASSVSVRAGDGRPEPFALAQPLGPAPAPPGPDGATSATGVAVTTGPAQRLALSDFDTVFVRKDPPFDQSYMRLLHCLQYAPPQTRVLADPGGLLRFTEKLVPTRLFPFMPDTLISQNLDEVEAFLAEKGRIVLKPLYRGGGAGVIRIDKDSQNLPALMELMGQLYREPVLVQEYLPEVRQGDKRALLVEGDVVGAFARIPDDTDFRSNLRVGGGAQATELTPRELEACRAIAPEMAAHGVVLAGADFIGERLTEVNVTSPTGARQLEMLTGLSAAAAYWDALERAPSAAPA